MNKLQEEDEIIDNIIDSGEAVSTEDTNKEELPKKHIKTLADTIPVVDINSLPSHLRFDGKTDIDYKKPINVESSKLEESIKNDITRFFEASGDRINIQNYIRFVTNKAKEEGTPLDFHDKYDGYFDYEDFCNSGFNKTGLTKNDFNGEIALFYNKKFSKNFNIEVGLIKDDEEKERILKGKTVEDEEEERRANLPHFDPDAEVDEDDDSAKLEKALYGVMDSIKKNTVSVETSVNRKYATIKRIARNVASEHSLKSIGIIAGAPGIGKTYTVEEAIEEGLELWSPNTRHQYKPELVKTSGSIGSAFSDILIYFYVNKNNKLILLDDADGFLLSPNVDIQNFIKSITTGKMKPIKVPPEKIIAANKKIRQNLENEKESVVISVDTNRLAEGICGVEVNGENFQFEVNESEAIKLGATFGYSKVEKFLENQNNGVKLDRYGRLATLTTLVEDSNAPSDNEMELFKKVQKAKEDADRKKSYDNDGKPLDLSDELVEDNFIFDSSIIFISNLRLLQLDSAVRSRMETCEIYLTPAEFIFRAEQILPTMEMGKFSSTSQTLIDWMKRESFAFFKILVLGREKYSNWDIDIQCQLDFRLLETLTGTFLTLALDYCNENKIDINNSDNYGEIEVGVKEDFIAELIRILETKDN